MTTIKQLPEIIDGFLTPSTKKVDSSLISLKSDGNIVSTPEGLSIDLTKYATKEEVLSAVASAQLEGKEVDLSSYITKEEHSVSVNSLEKNLLEKESFMETSFNSVPTINSIPLYTLSKEGSYVLCTPDVWLFNGSYYIPGYSKQTLEGE